MEILAVLVAAIAAMGVGALWYGSLFKKKFIEYSGVTNEEMSRAEEQGMVHLYIYNFLAIIVTTVILAIVMQMTGQTGTGGAIGLAVLLWLGMIAPISVQNVLWDTTPFRLYVLTTSQNLTALIVSAVVLSFFL